MELLQFSDSYICLETTWLLAVVGAVSMAIGYFYTGGPFPIAYTPFGELFSGVFMGMLIVLIAFYIQTKRIYSTCVHYPFLACCSLQQLCLSNNIRDIVGDKESGRRTMAILIGRKHSITVLLLLFIVSYVWIIVMVALGMITPWSFYYFKHKKTNSRN